MFSANIMGNQLIYIIIMLINEEMNKLSSLNEKHNFLQNEILGLFISELIKKSEIQNFFKIIIQDVINDINISSNENELEENDYISNCKINLDILNIEEIINQKINEKENEKKGKKGKMKKTESECSSLKESIKITNNNKNEDKNSDIKKYFDDVTLAVLEEKSLNDKSNNGFKEFCLNQINKMNQINKHNNMEIYSNQTLLKNIYRTQISGKIMNVYQHYFSIVIKTINYLLNNIQENITIIPGDLKIICKAIVLLAKKKFGDNLKYTDSVYFFGKFFIFKILLAFIKYPQHNYLLNNSLLFTEESFFNLDVIAYVFNKFYSGNLFLQSENGGNLTPFNGYFIDKITELYKIYENITSINLPANIQKLIDSENLENFNYEYNYFDEYKNEVLYHQSCCISFTDLLTLLKTIYHNKEAILNSDSNEQFKNCYENIIKDKNNLNYILEKSLKSTELSSFFFNKDNKNSNLKKIDIYSLSKTNLEYFIINRILFKDNYSKNKNTSSTFSYINLSGLNKEDNQNEENKDENNNNLLLSKMKDSLCQILYTIPYIEYMINNKNLKPNSLNDFFLFLFDIKIYQKFLTTYKSINQVQSFLPFEFAINFIIDNLKNLPEDYKKNNYKLFINYVDKEINDSIKTLNFAKLSQFYNNFEFLETKEEIQQKFISKLSKYHIYKKIKRIICQFPIFMKIKVINTNTNNFDNILIEIKQSISNAKKIKANDNIFIDTKRNIIVFKTIESLARNFSFEKDINFYLFEYLKYTEEKNIFNYINKCHFNEKVHEFFNKELRSILTESGFLDNHDKSNANKIISKIYDYFLNTLYNSIYNYLPSQKDKEITSKINQLSWTKLNNFIISNSNLYESLIHSIVDCFNRFEKSKIPSEKFFRFKEILEIAKNIPCKERINYLYKNKNKEVSLNPIIVYGIIKAKPKYIYSDIKYVLYFIQKKEKEIEEYFEYLLPSYILYIKEITHNSLYGNISKEEFDLKCNN